MTTIIYGWIVVKKDGEPYRNAKSNALAIFRDQKDARTLAVRLKGARSIPCTSQYEV